MIKYFKNRWGDFTKVEKIFTVVGFPLWIPAGIAMGLMWGAIRLIYLIIVVPIKWVDQYYS